MTSIPLPVLQPIPCVPTPWCTLFDNLKRRTQTDPGTAKKKRRSSALTPDRTSQPGLNDAEDNEQVQQLHPCPLCPRVFPLPNSLALHLKWHWGASGLEWKRGINRNGKGVERARREAEERRCRAPATHREQLPYGSEAGVPESANDPSTTDDSIRGVNGTMYPSPVDNPNVVTGDSSFIPQGVPQTSFEIFRMPCYSSSEASASTSEVGGSPAISPFDSRASFSFHRLPSLEELALPQPLAGNTLGARPCNTEFVLQEGLSHPSPGLAADENFQGITSNHTAWSHNWFGCDNLDQSPGIAAEGEQDLDDVLGNPHPFIEVHTHTEVDGQHGTQENREPLSCAKPGELELVQ
ncbi:transcription factor [Ganoderma sinense ZZ0214-1]|uniref:Transcription factor n=1 Tax=Ganoderma sinense ZZ0214-1 TaxID=1077348 RepID=A0A2G8RPE7_9APHY|nr:transcription factor [Ganoderma sinense ZZ0214-1]